MKVAIILNGISRKKKKFYTDIEPALSNHFDLQIFETQYAGAAAELASQASKQNFPVILAAGGDGTLHQVVNGMLTSGKEDLPALGLIPMGSGNDFARTCSMQFDARQIIQLLSTFQPKATDVGKVVCVNEKGESVVDYFINECSVGMGPAVVERLRNHSRRWGPSLSYFTSIISTFLSHRPQEVTCVLSDLRWTGTARVVAIANGRSFGHALHIAPDAHIDDGIFNAFLAGDVPLWKFLLNLQALKKSVKLSERMVEYHQTIDAELHSKELCPLEADGESIGFLPATVKILPGRIKVFR